MTKSNVVHSVQAKGIGRQQLHPEWEEFRHLKTASPKNATKEKGEILLEVCTDGIVNALNREFSDVPGMHGTAA